MYTILFLDEANTTEAIGLVKEIICDGRMRGEPLDRKSGLKIIAACNPYRRYYQHIVWLFCVLRAKCVCFADLLT